jgi:ubiquinone/menaquinone biosynthesis C-methylase UbiE
MLNVARRLIAYRGWRNVEVCEIDAAHLPFPDSSFDKAIYTYALNIIPDYVRSLFEVRRVLVPAGRLVSLELGSAYHSFPCRLQRRLPHICSMDLTRDTAEGLRLVFREALVRRLLMGMLVLSTAAKTETLDAPHQEMDQ